MSEDPFSERLKRLEDRLAAARAERQPKSRPGAAAKYTQSSIAWRMVTELVVGMLLGLGIGWGLDSLLGTRPVFLVLFALLGFAGGVRAMLRTASDVREGRSEAALTRGPENTAPGNGRNGTDEGRGADG
ncbi:AtpZ/AtpI family protein [Amaricoccus sp.]|uniref:AtpZ/AtpI family protein n=1 Tax=Amaricoccus sp. TaxID=1872485 RepID=UPI001B3EB629|nr:AtpZ/AtpI family protein [Amaricoccus sp.]MBP7002112.1 AtpZ/AtpI family protein [Amaricoccus sp.]